MELTLQSMKAVSDLMDQALELDDKARTQWLVTLSTGNHASLAPIVRQLLANRASMSTNFLSKPLQIDGVTSLNDLAKLTPTIVAGSRVGPYELTREVGRGGMGVVWLAERSDGQLDRQVALKLPMLHLQSVSFEREISSPSLSIRISLASMTQALLNLANRFSSWSTSKACRSQRTVTFNDCQLRIACADF